MISLIVWILIILLSLFCEAWAMAWTARNAGSARGRFWIAAIFVILLHILSTAAYILGASIMGLDKFTKAPWLVVSLAFIIAIYIAMIFVFKLSWKRAFIPFGGYLLGAVVALTLAALPIIMLAHPYKTPSMSMSPTIPSGGRFVADKFLPPRRWDIVIFKSWDDPKAIFVKRLIALPGERLRFDGGNIYVNGQLLNAPPVIAGKCHAFLPDMRTRGRYRDGQTITLGNGEYFVLGDDLDISVDSRLEGAVPADRLTGVVDLIYWPPAQAQILR